MSLIKYILNNFDFVWRTYCTAQMTGYVILGKEVFSSEKKFPLFWGYDEEKGLKVLVILLPHKSGYIPHTFVNVDTLQREFILGSHKFPRELSRKYTAVGEFHFQPQELQRVALDEKNLESILETKSKKIDARSYTIIFGRLNKIKAVKDTKVTRSVYAIPAGLYGLGKNRKH